MAKSELVVKNTEKQKRKAKKRQHEAQASDDEVANKSLIVDNQTENGEVAAKKEKKKSKSHKRKLAELSIKEKRSKKQKKQQEHSTDEDSDAEQQPQQQPAEEEQEQQQSLPTLEQLRESEKPENKLAVVTVRQKKKKKHQERLEAQKDQSADKEAKRNEEYLRKWMHERSEWKFEKLRQISIQQTVLDADKINAECWPIALAYLSGSKGAAKEKIMKLACDVIEELDKKCETFDDESARKEVLESVRYQRARELLQIFA